MRLEIKLYGPNKYGILEEWPEKVKELKEGETAKDGYLEMTKEEYESYLVEKKPLYDQYEQAQSDAINELEYVENLIKNVDTETRLSLRRTHFLNAFAESQMHECFLILDKFPGTIPKPLIDQLIPIFQKYDIPK